MGCCNGRKNRVRPAGTDAKRKSGDSAAAQANSTSLGKSRRTQTFEVKSKSGKTLTFHSKLEAKAEVARNGGVLKF